MIYTAEGDRYELNRKARISLRLNCTQLQLIYMERLAEIADEMDEVVSQRAPKARAVSG